MKSNITKILKLNKIISRPKNFKNLTHLSHLSHRSSSVNYSSEIFAKESSLQTYWRGNLVSFEYKNLYENSTDNNTQIVHNRLDSLEHDNLKNKNKNETTTKTKTRSYSDDIK